MYRRKSWKQEYGSQLQKEINIHEVLQFQPAEAVARLDTQHKTKLLKITVSENPKSLQET